MLHFSDVGGDRLRNLARDRKLQRVTRGIYSDDLKSTPEQIVRDDWMTIVGHLIPDAVITGRSAFTARPADGWLFVSSPRTRDLVLPGLTVVSSPGLPPQPTDTALGGSGLYLASEARGLVDNAVPSRERGSGRRRTLSRAELHDVVVGFAQRPHDRQVRLLADVREYAAAAGAPGLADEVEMSFQAARGDRPSVQSTSEAMNAAKRGTPYDAARVRLFEAAVRELATIPPRIRLGTSREAALFYEAYFSNYIEGTEFTVEEARHIALTGQPPRERPADGRDILHTLALITDPSISAAVPASAEDLLDLLKQRHSQLMTGRDETAGTFKSRANQAGATGTRFVEPHLVDGTLRAGWAVSSELLDPFGRAVFMMLLVSEVHPFPDGNGRIARMTMNAELQAAGQTRLILPTIMREEYLSGLVRFSAGHDTRGLVAVLDFAQRYTSQIDFTNFESATAMLAATHAFADARRSDVRIQLPETLPPGWSFEPGDLLAETEDSPAGIMGGVLDNTERRRRSALPEDGPHSQHPLGPSM